MAASMASSSAITTVSRSTPVQASLTSSFTKSTSAFTAKRFNKESSLPSKSMTVKCMKVWPPLGLKKFETLSYLPPLSDEELLKEIDYLLRSKWIPCLEFEVGDPFVSRMNNRSPGYYDGRYWTMWKLPMYGCTDSSQVLKEVQEAKTAYPQAHVRIIGFDNVRQVQCCSFIAYQPPE